MKEKDALLYRFAAAGICAAFIAAGIYIGIKYLLGILMPFAIAWLAAVAVRPIAMRVQKRIRLPHKIVSAVLLIAFLSLCGYGLFYVGSLLFQQTSNFLTALTEDLDSPDNALRRTVDFFINLKDKLPFADKFVAGVSGSEDVNQMLESFYAIVTDMAKSGAQRASNALTSWAASFLTSLPGAVFFLVVSVVSMFFISFDYTQVTDFFRRLIPKPTFQRITDIKNRFLKTIAGYLRAYLLLLFLTFAELLSGFLILNVNYALILALLISVLDLLPVIGAGSFLLPWSVIMLISGNYRLGWGLLILFCVMYLIRQIAEPRIVGRCIGVHPLATLFSVYAGYRLFGLAGMLVGPVIALIVKLLLYGEKQTSEAK